MPPVVLRARRVLTPLEEISDGAVVIEEGKIAGAGKREGFSAPKNATEENLGDAIIAPGLIDLHIHGAGGHDFMEGSVSALESATAAVARYGTTALLATTVTASPEDTCHSLENIAGYMVRQASGLSRGAEILGVHLEGPFISTTRRGVHPSEHIAAPSLAILERLLSAAHEHVRILTVAPELPGALELIAAAGSRGVVPGIGHTDASYEEAQAAFDCGARHAVHVFNAMRPFAHRQTGVLGAILTDARVTAEVIADGVHVDAVAIRLLLAAKGAARVVLVSDGIAATGMPDGKYRLGTFEVKVRGGICRNAEGRLAGSTLTLDRALRFVVNLGVPLREAVCMATLQPAQQIEARHKGALKTGADADLAVFTPGLQLSRVMLRGTWLAGSGSS